MKRAVLTGATGFVGANLARRLLHDGHEVHLLVRHGYASWRIEEIRTHALVHEVDLADEGSLRALMRRLHPDWVFHLAAYGGYASQADLARMVHTNFLATINLVQACLTVGFEAFVNTGSSSEYGWRAHPPAEVEPLEPNSHYALTKASATMFCRYTARSQRVRMPTLRLYSVYGPYEEPTRLLPTVIARGLAGALPALVDPDIARDFVYAEDVSSAYLLAAAHDDPEPGAIYNVGTGVQTTLRQVVTIAQRTLGITTEPHWGSMPNRSWDTTTWVADNRKARRELGWQPQYTFEQGFCALVSWFRQHPDVARWYAIRPS